MIDPTLTVPAASSLEQATGAAFVPSAAALCYTRVGLIGKHESTGAGPLLSGIARFVQQLGAQVVVAQETHHANQMHGFETASLAQIGQHCDVAIVVGGDGTMLGVARQLAAYDLPLVGINQGRLGFVTDIPVTAYEEPLCKMLCGEVQEDTRSLMQAQVWRGERLIFESLAMNDVVVNRGNSAGMVELRIEVDGRFVANQRADGLIVATPTGATAYALSVGGPLLHPSIPGWILAPIAPHTLSNRPIVLSDDVQVSIEIVAGRDASANFDMQHLAEILIGDRIVVRRSPHRVCFLHPTGWSYFDTLRKKLHWNEGGS